MKIRSISLDGWRNYFKQSVDFGDSPSLFLGPNGQGKTNLIEAIVYAAKGNSHRTHLDSVLVNPDFEKAIIKLVAKAGERSIEVDLEISASGNNISRVNGQPTKIRDLPSLLPVALFAPEDIDLVRGEPENRRRFLDEILKSKNPRLAALISDYEKILKQRNSLLKSIRGKTASQTTTLESWTASLVSAATVIMKARRDLVKQLSPLIAKHYSAIAPENHSFEIQISESIPEETNDEDIERVLTQMFHVKHSEEIERGATLYGPHRDDLVLQLNHLPARTHSSQGEAWSTALALRLAQLDVLKQQSRVGDPVVILDDVFSELDPERRSRLALHLSEIEQVIITAADEESIPDGFTGSQYLVEKGNISQPKLVGQTSSEIIEPVLNQLQKVSNAEADE